MDRYGPTASFLGRPVPQLNRCADFTARIEDHCPSQLRYLTRAETGLDGKQNDCAIAVRIPGTGGKVEEVVDVLIRKYLCLLTSHLVSQISFVADYCKAAEALNIK